MFRTYDTSAIRPKRSPVPAIIAIVVLVIAAVAIVFGLVSFVRGCGATPQVAKGTEVQVTIDEGEGSRSVAKTLVDAGLIASQSEFIDRLAQAGAENSLQPGTYTLVGGQSVDEIITVLQTPVTAAVKFTVPEGSTIEQTAQIVSDASEGRISVDAFTAEANNAMKYRGEFVFLETVDNDSLEGFLFPKTYPLEDDATAETVVRAMLSQFGAETAGLDVTYAQQRSMTLYDIVKLASIVEKESDVDHRAEVASVFYNRLNEDMLLQSDATVAYVVGHDPTPSDVATYSEYNTYFIDGLPPTPIDSPSLECMKAVCAPASTSYYYFYFEPDENGNMVYSFSETYEDHQAVYE